MIYNLAHYLITQLGTIHFTVDGWTINSDETGVLITQIGGYPTAWYDRTSYSIQVTARSVDRTISRSMIYAVYNKLKNRFGLTLPTVTVAGTVYPAIVAYQISPDNVPMYMGADDKNLEVWSATFRVITK